MHSALHERTSGIFSLIKEVTEGQTDPGDLLRIVHDLAAAALASNDAYLNYYQAGGRLRFEEWNLIWHDLADLAYQARQPGWSPSSDFEAHMQQLDGYFELVEHEATARLANQPPIRHNG